MLQALYLFGSCYRQLVWLSIIALTLLLGSGIPNIPIDTGLDSLIASSDPDRLAYQRVLEEFGTDENVYVFIEAENIWSLDKLQIINRLHSALEQVDGVKSVSSLFTLRTLQRVDNELESGLVINRELNDELDISSLRNLILQNQLFIDTFFADNGRVSAIVVSLEDEVATQNIQEQIYQDIETELDKVRGDFQDLIQIGTPRLNYELKTQLAEDFILLGPLSALVVLVLILIFVRSVLAAVIPIITSTIAIVWTFGLQGWFGLPINILSTILPLLIIIVSAFTTMHLVIAYLKRLRKYSGLSHEDIIKKISRKSGLSFLLAISIITIAFASNVFNEIGIIRDFAIASTFAMLVHGIISILVIPDLLRIYQRSSGRFVNNNDEEGSYPGKFILTYSYSHGRFAGVVLIFTLIASGYFFYHASTFYVTNDPLLFFSDNQELMQDHERLHEDLSGVHSFFITLASNSEKAFLEPRNIEKLSLIQNFVREQEVFDSSRSLSDLLKYVHKEIQGEQPGLPLPRSRQLVAQYLVLFHRSELENYVSQDYSRANIIVRHNINDSRLLNDYISELEGVVSQFAGAELVSTVVGKNLMVHQAAENLKHAQVNSFAILVTLIFIIVSILFTSYKGGVIALIPAVVPVIIMFGVMGLLNIPLNPGTAMVGVIAVALAVDGTIHLLTRYIEHCRKSSDFIGAVNAAVNEVAPSMIISTIALSVGFSILTLSEFTVVAQFGALITATILLSILTNLLITPILMSRIRLVGLYQILAMSLDEDSLDNCILFHNMTDYQRRKAILISELHEFKAGELLIEQDTAGRSMFLILSGEADVIRRDDGQDNVLATLGCGQIFGEIGYIRETQRTADVRAKSDLTALKFDYERLQKDLKYFPNIVAKLNFNISYILGKRLADMVEQSK